MALFDDAGEARVILTKRPETMPSHQGEIAFPGGKLEEGVDAALRDAALREAHEEIGLDPASVDVLAELDSLTTVAGRFLLTPFVGALGRRPELTPHVDEVVSVFDVAISELLDDDAFREERWDIPAEPGEVGFARSPDETPLAASTKADGAWAPTGRASWAEVAQSSPPVQCSRFQIGTVSLRVSIANRAASKASARCGDETTTATDASERSRSPVRCRSAIRSRSGQRRRASAAISRMRRTATSSYAS